MILQAMVQTLTTLASLPCEKSKPFSIIAIDHTSMTGEYMAGSQKADYQRSPIPPLFPQGTESRILLQ